MSARASELLHAANVCILKDDSAGAAVFMLLLERELARAIK